MLHIIYLLDRLIEGGYFSEKVREDLEQQESYSLMIVIEIHYGILDRIMKTKIFGKELQKKEEPENCRLLKMINFKRAVTEDMKEEVPENCNNLSVNIGKLDTSII